MRKNLVVKDNALINASYSLDLVEQRLILLAIVEARKTGKGINANDALSVHAASYMQNFNVERQPAYISLKKACDDLFLRQFSYQTVNENGNVQNHRARWVSEIIYIENEATVKLIFSPAVVPLVTELEKHFTSYELEQVSGLSSAYAVRLYEILIAWRSTGKVPMIKLMEFRNRLGVGINEYSKMVNFKARVLDLAINQINEYTDITASYEQHKQGRVIVGFSFKFKQKPQRKLSNQTETTTTEQTTPRELEIKPLVSESQAIKYALQLKEHSEIKRFFNYTDTNDLIQRIKKVLLTPNEVNTKAQKVVFQCLAQTDFKDIES
jgi:plasmid replication initiation protein